MKQLKFYLLSLNILSFSYLLLILCGCDKNDEVENKVPIVAFTADQTLLNTGSSVQFTDQSTNNPSSWSWDFGDGGTSASQNPSYQYNTVGTYTVSLTSTNSYGSNTETKTNYITVTVNGQTGTVNDYFGNTYNIIKIGSQWWMAENLKTARYNDGTHIPFVRDDCDWAGLGTPAYCWYNNEYTNKNPYGALYNWHTVNTGKLCPTGWHIPSDAEWAELQDYLGDSVAGGKMKETGTEHWSSPNTGATNESGFSALPGGYRTTWYCFSGNTFYSLHSYGGFWSATEMDYGYAWGWGLYFESAGFGRGFHPKGNGRSVRCVKD